MLSSVSTFPSAFLPLRIPYLLSGHHDAQGGGKVPQTPGIVHSYSGNLEQRRSHGQEC